MKRVLLLAVFAAFSCTEDKIKIAENNIKIYLQSSANGQYEVKDIKILKLDTITDLHLKKHLISYYSYRADHSLELAKKHQGLAKSSLNMLKLSKSLKSSVLSDNYKSDFDNNMEDFKIHNDSAKYYNDILYKLVEIKPDSVNIQYYGAKIHYNVVNINKTANEGDDLYIFLNKDFNLIESNKMIEIAKSKLLE